MSAIWSSETYSRSEVDEANGRDSTSYVNLIRQQCRRRSPRSNSLVEKTVWRSGESPNDINDDCSIRSEESDNMYSETTSGSGDGCIFNCDSTSSSEVRDTNNTLPNRGMDNNDHHRLISSVRITNIEGKGHHDHDHGESPAPFHSSSVETISHYRVSSCHNLGTSYEYTEHSKHYKNNSCPFTDDNPAICFGSSEPLRSYSFMKNNHHNDCIDGICFDSKALSKDISDDPHPIDPKVKYDTLRRDEVNVEGEPLPEKHTKKVEIEESIDVKSVRPNNMNGPTFKVGDHKMAASVHAIIDEVLATLITSDSHKTMAELLENRYPQETRCRKLSRHLLNLEMALGTIDHQIDIIMGHLHKAMDVAGSSDDVSSSCKQANRALLVLRGMVRELATLGQKAGVSQASYLTATQVMRFLNDLASRRTTYDQDYFVQHQHHEVRHRKPSNHSSRKVRNRIKDTILGIYECIYSFIGGKIYPIDSFAGRKTLKLCHKCTTSWPFSSTLLEFRDIIISAFFAIFMTLVIIMCAKHYGPSLASQGETDSWINLRYMVISTY